MCQTLLSMQVVGEAEIEEILEDDIHTVWNMTKEHSGITYQFFLDYYRGKKKLWLITSKI